MLKDNTFIMCTDSCLDTENDSMFSVQYASQGRVQYGSVEKYGFCMPTNPSDLEDGENQEAEIALNAQIGDVQTAWPVIAGTAGFAMISCILYLYLIKTCGGCIIYGMILALLGGVLALAYLCWEAAGGCSPGDVKWTATPHCPEFEEDWFMVIATILLLFINFIMLCIFICSREQIKKSIAIVKAAGEAMKDMPMLLFLPIPFMFMFIGFMICWLFSMAFMLSVGKWKDVATPAALSGQTINGDLIPATYKVWSFNDELNDTIWMNVFFMFLNMNFLYYTVYITVAGACCDWYFKYRYGPEADKRRGADANEKTIKALDNAHCYPEGQTVPKSPISRALWRGLRYHSGSIAFAAILLAIVQTLQAWYYYMEKMQGDPNKQSRVQKYISSCIHCLLECIKRIVDKFNKNALILTAMGGSALCESGFKSAMLVLGNFHLFAILALITGLFTRLGKLLVLVFSMACAYGLLIYTEPYKSKMTGIVFSMFLCMVVAYAVACLFMSVWNMLIDTLILCLCVEEDWNGKGNYVFAPKTISGQLVKTMKDAGDQFNVPHDSGVKSNKVAPAPADNSNSV